MLPMGEFRYSKYGAQPEKTMVRLLAIGHGLSSAEIISHALDLNTQFIFVGREGRGCSSRQLEWNYECVGFLKTEEIDLGYMARCSQKDNPD